MDTCEKTNRTENHGDETLSPIQKFFNGVNVFVTGATGLVGIALLVKLLTACPGISKIYLLVRSKKGKNVATRLDELFDDVVFSRVKEQNPNFREKIVSVEGDCELPNLGISDQDRVMLMKETNVVFHVAATVRFDEKLHKACFLNVRGVRDIMRLAQQMQNLKSFIHVSTAFSNCIHNTIKEEVYPPPIDYEKLITLVEGIPADILDAVTPRLIGKFPNTYAFTKQIAEDAVKQEGKGLPIGIHRPTIILSGYKEPLRGWTNSIYGPNGLLVAGALGLAHAVKYPAGKRADLVPVDMVANSMIAAAWEVGEMFAKDSNVATDVTVYNYGSSEKKITWKDFVVTCESYVIQYLTVKGIWYPAVVLCSTRLYYVVAELFLHRIPAILIDGARICMGKPPMLLETYNKIYRGFDLINYFLHNEWIFESDNVRRLKARMCDEDRKIFFCDMEELDWKDYLMHDIIGLRLYILKDPMDSLPEAIKRRRRLYWIHQITKYTSLTLFTWIVWCTLSLLFKIFW